MCVLTYSIRVDDGLQGVGIGLALTAREGMSSRERGFPFVRGTQEGRRSYRIQPVCGGLICNGREVDRFGGVDGLKDSARRFAKERTMKWKKHESNVQHNVGNKE